MFCYEYVFVYCLRTLKIQWKSHAGRRIELFIIARHTFHAHSFAHSAHTYNLWSLVLILLLVDLFNPKLSNLIKLSRNEGFVTKNRSHTDYKPWMLPRNTHKYTKKHKPQYSWISTHTVRVSTVKNIYFIHSFHKTKKEVLYLLNEQYTCSLVPVNIP